MAPNPNYYDRLPSGGRRQDSGGSPGGRSWGNAFKQALGDAASFAGKVQEVVSRTAASAQEMLTDRELRRMGTSMLISGAQKGFQEFQRGVLGRLVNRQQLQSLLSRIESQIGEFQRERQLQAHKRLMVDIQVGRFVYDSMPQEVRTRIWYTLLEKPELAAALSPCTKTDEHFLYAPSKRTSHADSDPAQLASANGSMAPLSDHGTNDGDGDLHTSSAPSYLHGEDERGGISQQESSSLDTSEKLPRTSPAPVNTNQGTVEGPLESSQPQGAVQADVNAGPHHTAQEAEAGNSELLPLASAGTDAAGQTPEKGGAASAGVEGAGKERSRQASATASAPSQAERKDGAVRGEAGASSAENREPLLPAQSSGESNTGEADSDSDSDAGSLEHDPSPLDVVEDFVNTLAEGVGRMLVGEYQERVAEEVAAGGVGDYERASTSAGSAASDSTALIANPRASAAAAEEARVASSSMSSLALSSGTAKAAGEGGNTTNITATYSEPLARLPRLPPKSYSGQAGLSAATAGTPSSNEAWEVMRFSDSFGFSDEDPFGDAPMLMADATVRIRSVLRQLGGQYTRAGAVDCTAVWSLRARGSSSGGAARKEMEDGEVLAHRALFEASLQVPWVPGEGIPHGYSPECRFAMLVEMTAGQEEVDDIIMRDVSRTFPGHPMFSAEQGQQALFRVLKAYSLHDLEVAYCQGMAFLAGVLLMYLPEEVAFRLYCRLMDPDGPNLRRLYLPGLNALKHELGKIDYFMQRRLPDLHARLQDFGIPPVLYASQWLMTVYATPFPSPFCSRLVDIMLQEGHDNIMLRLAFSMLEELEPEMLKLHDFEHLLTHLKVEPAQWNTTTLSKVIDRALDSGISQAEIDVASKVVAMETERLLRENNGEDPYYVGQSLTSHGTKAGEASSQAAADGSTDAAASCPVNGHAASHGQFSSQAEGSGHAHVGHSAGESAGRLGRAPSARQATGGSSLDLDAEYMEMLMELDLLDKGGGIRMGSGVLRPDEDVDAIIADVFGPNAKH